MEQTVSKETWTIPAGLKRRAADLYREICEQKPRAFLWAPVFLAFGIGIYFALPAEPPLILGAFALAAFCVPVAVMKERTPALLFLLIAAGFLAAQIRTHVVHTPVLKEKRAPLSLTGRVEALEDYGDEAGVRVTLSHLSIEDLGPEETPRRARLRLRHEDALVPGQRVKVLAGLNPPSPPVMPGAFDFRRYLYFQGIGAVGFVYGHATVLEEAAPGGAHVFTERLRQKVGEAVERHMPYPAAGVAMALMIGRKTAIEEGDKEAMRHAGLAHMLAISGLHIGLFSGVLFFISRLVMALIPGMALRYPIKKYAALFAMAGACVYMMLAGASIPTQRALLMTGIVFLAILLDRSPISLRLVAFAAFCVLLFFPESLLSASFHMSFAAVTGLIVFYEWLRPYWSAWHRQAGPFKRAALYFTGVALTTVVATLATAPFALFHFNQLAVFSLVANIIAVPVLAFLIMPGVVMALLLIPFHLESLAFIPVRFGVEAVLDVAHWVSGFERAVLILPSWPLAALVCFVMAALIFFLWRGRLRFAAAVFVVLAVISIARMQPYDILASPGADLMAVKTPGGLLQVSTFQKERFVRENWVRAYGIEEDAPEKFPGEGGDETIMCDPQACRIHLKNYKISYIREEPAMRAECAYADIAIAPFPLRTCKAPVVLDLFKTQARGAHGIRLRPEGLQIETVENFTGKRPWSGF